MCNPMAKTQPGDVPHRLFISIENTKSVHFTWFPTHIRICMGNHFDSECHNKSFKILRYSHFATFFNIPWLKISFSPYFPHVLMAFQLRSPGLRTARNCLRFCGTEGKNWMLGALHFCDTSKYSLYIVFIYVYIYIVFAIYIYINNYRQTDRQTDR
jgi:hypothetical protein